jgi:hypothetical protein
MSTSIEFAVSAVPGVNVDDDEEELEDEEPTPQLSYSQTNLIEVAKRVMAEGGKKEGSLVIVGASSLHPTPIHKYADIHLGTLACPQVTSMLGNRHYLDDCCMNSGNSQRSKKSRTSGQARGWERLVLVGHGVSMNSRRSEKGWYLFGSPYDMFQHSPIYRTRQRSHNGYHAIQATTAEHQLDCS